MSRPSVLVPPPCPLRRIIHLTYILNRSNCAPLVSPFSPQKSHSPNSASQSDFLFIVKQTPAPQTPMSCQGRAASRPLTASRKPVGPHTRFLPPPVAVVSSSHHPNGVPFPKLRPKHCPGLSVHPARDLRGAKNRIMVLYDDVVRSRQPLALWGPREPSFNMRCQCHRHHLSLLPCHS